MRLHYRPTNGRPDYVFDIERVANGLRVYIVRQPEYPRGSATDGVSTHRLGLDTDRPYICWSAPIPDLDQAKTIAAIWAESTEAYIETGTFPLRLFTDWNETPDIAAATRSFDAASPRTGRAGATRTPSNGPLSFRARLRERIIR